MSKRKILSNLPYGQSIKYWRMFPCNDMRRIDAVGRVYSAANDDFQPMVSTLFLVRSLKGEIKEVIRKDFGEHC
jgi:hypothetical protein